MAPQSGLPAGEQRPRPYDPDRHEELVQRLGRILLEIAPSGWRRVDLRVTMTAAVSDVALTVLMPDGGSTEVEPPRDFADIAAELRSMMYVPDEGTWFGMRFTMDPPDEYRISFNGGSDPHWEPPIPPGVWAHDLSVFPRTAEHIPPWLRAKLDSSSPPASSGTS
ncbi:hypothetical protein [Spirillospora sp. NPDC029432]|uniref:hypothetical protein n=1 Tax=Spirillospora sp. NPDC029432 TaxID=3154599 RepID=UPI003451F4B8